jgi:hypothetical protein
MEILDSHTIRLWTAQFVIVLFLVGGLFVFAVGAGLIVWDAGMQRIFAALNRWVSTRRALRPLDVPHDTTRIMHRYRRWLAAFFVVGACYSMYGLGISYNERGFISILGMQAWPSYFAAWLAESARWILLLGNAIAIAAGIMLAFSPDKLAALESKGGKWFSDRQIAKGADTMNDPLDKLVSAHPRAAGWFFALAGVVMMGDFGVMWYRL